MKDILNERGDPVEEIDGAAEKRQQRSLREFKEVLQNLVYLLRKAVNAETSYLYWINRSRRQFVMETHSTRLKEVRFQDRISFENIFLNEYKDIEETVKLKVGQDIQNEWLIHYSNENFIKQILLVPFINKGEAVALTVLEWNATDQPEQKKVMQTYTQTLGKLLNSNLEITGLYENQQEWVNYEQKLSFLNKPGHPAALLNEMLQTLQAFLPDGSVSLIAKGMGIWCNLLNSKLSVRPLPAGLPVEKRTLAADSLKNISDEFAIHFNNNPKRISPREDFTDGASYAVPVNFNKHSKAAVLMNDENPLVFNESTKHKLKNIVRLAGLKIQARLNGKEQEGQLLSNKFSAFIPDIWQEVIDTEIARLKRGEEFYNSWIGFAALSNLSKLRSQLRLEELKNLQMNLVKALNPNRVGTPGIVGMHSDYIYMILLQSKEPEALGRWQNEVRQKFSKPFLLNNDKQIESSVDTGFVLLGKDDEDAYSVIQKAKAMLNSNS